MLQRSALASYVLTRCKNQSIHYYVTLTID